MATVALESCPLDDAIDSDPSHEIYVSALQAEVAANVLSAIDPLYSNDGVLAPCASCSLQEASEYQNVSIDTIANTAPSSSSYVCEWTTTHLRLRSPPRTSQDERRQRERYLCLPSNVISDTSATLVHDECKDDLFQGNPAVAHRLRLLALNEHLAAHPSLYSHKLFSTGRGAEECEGQHRFITAANSGRIINVLQGEIAHATPHQADVLVSDDATTCHIVALRSVCNLFSEERRRKVGRDVQRGDPDCPLATMSHIDGTGYESCIRDAVMEHVRHHWQLTSERCRKSNQKRKGNRSRRTSFHDHCIEVSIHIMGGFEDDDGSSIEITDDILAVFSTLAKEFDERADRAYDWEERRPRVSMILETCVVSGANDDGTGCPVGRGLGLNVASGEVFLAEVDIATLSSPLSSQYVVKKIGASSFGGDLLALDGDLPLLMGGREAYQPPFLSAAGPETLLRSIRLWAAALHPSNNPKQKRKLVIIHRPDKECLTIQPFFFGPHPYAKKLLSLDDANLLQATSTSPMVEKSNFVSNVRESLAYMNETSSSYVFEFSHGVHQPLEYRRVGLNGWVRCN